MLASFQANLGPDAEGKPALHQAIEMGATVGVVWSLLKGGAHVEATDKVRRKHEVDAIARRLERRVHVYV